MPDVVSCSMLIRWRPVKKDVGNTTDDWQTPTEPATVSGSQLQEMYSSINLL